MKSTAEKTRMTHEQFYKLCTWIERKGDDLWDVPYPDRAKIATDELEFTVTPAKVKEASALTGHEHHIGRINVIYWALVALAGSGGTTLPNLARKGRELAKEQAKARAADGTGELFPEEPAAGEDFLPDLDGGDEIPDMV